MMSTASTLIQCVMRTTSGWMRIVCIAPLVGRRAAPLHAPPARRLTFILQDDTLVEKFVPDAIGRGEVASLARRGALGDALVDPRLAHAGGRGAQEVLGLPVQKPAHRSGERRVGERG